MLSWSLLVCHVVVRHSLIDIHPLASLLCCHVEDRRCLARVVDDDVVDIIVIYDVSHMASRALGLNPLLLLWVARWWSTTPHAEPLAIRDSLAFKPTLIFTLLGHRVFSKLLRTSEGSLLIVSIAINEIVILLLALLSCIRLLSVIRAEDTAIAVSHVTLSSQLALIRHSGIIFKVRLRNFHVRFLALAFDLSNDRKGSVLN